MMRLLPALGEICYSLPLPFSTKDVIERLKTDYPEVWKDEFLSRHVEGGRGCGKPFSAFSLVATQIPRYGFKRRTWGDSRQIARDWGSGAIAVWERRPITRGEDFVFNFRRKKFN